MQEGSKYSPGTTLSLVDIIKKERLSTFVPRYYIKVAAPVQPGIAIPTSRVVQEGPKCDPGLLFLEHYWKGSAAAVQLGIAAPPRGPVQEGPKCGTGTALSLAY